MQPKLSPDSRFKHSLKSTPKKQRDYGHFRSDDSPSPLGATDGGGDTCSSRFVPISRSRVVERLLPPPSPCDSGQNRPCACPGLGKARQAPLSLSLSLSLSLPPFLVLAGMRRGLGALHGHPGVWAALRRVALHTDSSHPPSENFSPVREGRKANDARNCHLHRPPRAMRAPRPCLNCRFCRSATHAGSLTSGSAEKFAKRGPADVVLEDQGIYQSKVRDMINDNGHRLIVNINDLRRKNEKRASRLLNSAFEELVAFQRALKDFVASVDATYSKQYEDFYIGLEGSFGSKHVTPRTLTSQFLSCIVCVEGIVTKCSLVRPKVVRSVHYCPATKKSIERRYTDLTSLEAFPSSAVYPTKDEENNPLETEFGLSTYKDHQTITIQEMPEKAPAGQLPRSVDIILDDDLVDKVKPGDRIQIIGTFRCLPSKRGGYTSGTFRTILIACQVKQMSKEVQPEYSSRDVSKIKKFSKQHSKDVFEQLSKSLAPSIHGHEYIKKAILCMLLGGVEKVLENGSRLRGDINILLIGDPSVAKSQLLRYVLCTAPRAIPTTGRGSSGVGLTAAVTTDQETAMPLGSAVELLATEDPSFTEEEDQELQVYERHDDLLHGPRRRKEKIVSMDFMRKYIHFAKMLKPVLTEEAAALLAQEYSSLRSQEQISSDNARTSPITPRTLETLIRLSTAHAKARMSKIIEKQDAKAAVELVQFAYFKKVLEKEKKRKKQTEEDPEEETDGEMSQEREKRKKKRRKTDSSEQSPTEGETHDPYDFSDTEAEMPEIQAHPSKIPEASSTDEITSKLSESRFKTFKAALLEVFRVAHAQSVNLKSLLESINRDNPTPFSSAEVKAALEQMQEDNQIMMSDDIIFLI